MANTLQGGFHPVSEATARYTRYEVASSYGTALFSGDACIMATGGVIEAATAGDADLIMGVIKTCSYVQNGQRIDSRYIPATTVYSPTARFSRNATYVWVYDDPMTEFWVCVDTAAGVDTLAEIGTAVGSNMDMVAGAGSTVYGQSGHTLDGTPVAGVAQFRIKEIRRIPGRTLPGANFQARVTINEGAHAAFSNAGI